MCGKWSKEYYLKYQEHHCSNTDINGTETNSEYNNDNNNLNNINNSQIRDNKKRKINERKYINKSQNPNIN